MSVCGNVRIWEARSGRLLDVDFSLKGKRNLPFLTSITTLGAVNDRVLCISVRYSPLHSSQEITSPFKANYNPVSDVFLICMGVVSQTDGSRAIVWKGVDSGEFLSEKAVCLLWNLQTPDHVSRFTQSHGNMHATQRSSVRHPHIREHRC